MGGFKHSAPGTQKEGQGPLLELPEQPIRMHALALRWSCAYTCPVLHLFFLIDPNRLLLVCPASRLRAVVQGMRPGSAFSLLCLKLQRLQVTSVGMRTFLASLVDVHP